MKRLFLFYFRLDSDAHLLAINPRKATPNLHRLYINFARFYEEGGASGKAESDLDSARKILEKATKVNFKAVEDLAEIWCEWAELELRQEYVRIILTVRTSSFCSSETMMKLSESCNVLLPFHGTPKSTTTIM